MKIYTKTGDDGMTGLLGNRRVPKDDSGSRPTERSTSSTQCSAWRGRTGWTPRPTVCSRPSRTSCSSSARRSPILLPTARFTTPSPTSTSSTPRTAIDALEAELEAADSVHPAGRHARGRADPPGADRLPPRRAAGRQALAPARRGRSERSARLPESAERPPVRAGPRVNHRAGVADVLWKGI